MKRPSDDADGDRKRSREKVPSDLDNRSVCGGGLSLWCEETLRDLHPIKGSDESLTVQQHIQATEVLPAQHQANTTDKELNQVMELSIVESEERHLQEAIRNSTTKNGHTKPLVDLTGTEEDPQLQQAMLESLQTATTVSEIDPISRKRLENIPVGLKNVGNTCYVNSLLQTYYMLPQLRKLIFHINADDKEDDDAKAKQVKKFVRELQLLFGQLSHTNVKWVDPSNLLNSIVNENGKSLLSIGRQEDIEEFMNLFVDWMDRGLKLYSDEAHEQKDIMKEMFQFEVIDLFTAKEEDGEPIETFTKQVHSFIILDVKYKDFYFELDEALVAHLDWKTPKNFETQAQTHTWLTSVPPVVMFQERRATFDRATNRPTKNRTPMKFKKDIDLARYMHENKESTTEKRIIVRRFRDELDLIQKKIQKSQEFPWPTIFPLAIKYYQDGLDPDIPPPGETFLETLKNQFFYHQQKLNDLEKQIETLREKIELTYADVTGKPYTLFAVWIHSGPTTGSGHYWTYIRNCQLDTWYKFNDMQVDFVQEDEVWRHATGGEDSNVSAYFLIYISNDFASTYGDVANSESFVPPFVYKQVEKENQEFTALIEKHIKEQSTIESGVDKFCRLYHESQNGAEISQSCYYDPRIASFGAWLRDHNLEELEFQGMLVTHLWRQCLSEKELGEHILTKSVEFNEVKKKLFHPSFTKKAPSTSEIDEKEIEDKAEECLLLGVKIAHDPEKKNYFDSYHFFRFIYQQLVEGFKNLESKNYNRALEYFYEAYKSAKSASFKIPLRFPDIKSILRITIIVIVEDCIQDIKDPNGLDMNMMPNSRKTIPSVVQLVASVFSLIQLVFKDEAEDSWISNCRHMLIDAAMAMTTNPSYPILEDMVSSTLVEGRHADFPSITDLKLPELPEECYADLAKQYSELLAKFCGEYKKYKNNYKLKNCEFPDDIVTMQVEEESPAQEDNNSN